MGVKENAVSDAVRIAAWEKHCAPLYRNNCGFDERTKTHYGLKVGSADWIGIYPVIITPDMVGRRVGVFFSIETKATTKPTTAQLAWQASINERGGIAVVARKPEDIPDTWEFPIA